MRVLHPDGIQLPRARTPRQQFILRERGIYPAAGPELQSSFVQ
jgi:hypothetical protein